MGSIASKAAPRRTVLQAKTNRLLLADFYAPAARLIVEVDGSQHAGLWQAEYDKRRTACFEDIGLRVLRFNDREALLEIDSVTQRIFRAVKRNPPKSPFPQRGRSLTCKSQFGGSVLPLFEKEG